MPPVAVPANRPAVAHADQSAVAPVAAGGHDWPFSAPDGLFLLLIVLGPALTYLPFIGFNSDDWMLLSLLKGVADQPWPDYLGRLRVIDPLRPGFAVMGLLGYALSGTVPFGYHLLRHAVLVLVLVLLVAVLRRLGMSRALALTVATLFALTPSASTLRFWVTAGAMYPSMAACLISLGAALLATTARPRLARGLDVFSVLAALGSLLLYELCAPFLLLAPLVVWWDRQGRPPLVPAARLLRRPDRRLLVQAATMLAVFALALAYKLATSQRFAPQEGGAVPLLARAEYLALGALHQHLVAYGVGLPVLAWTALTDHLSLPNVLAAVMTGCGVGAYLAAVLARGPLVGPSGAPPAAGWQRGRLLRVTALGAVLLAAGYAIFLTNDEYIFVVAGLGDRIAQVGAFGAAVILAGTFGLAAGCLRRPILRRVAFCTLVGLHGGMGTLVLLTVADFWEGAYVRSLDVLGQIQRAAPTLAPGSAVLLESGCPWHGPATVFASNWDVTGALRVIYGDRTLRGDVLAYNLEAGEDDVFIWTHERRYGYRYPYGERLLLFNVERDTLLTVRSADDLAAYLGAGGPQPSLTCPTGTPPAGVPIFPLTSPARPGRSS
jgi:hypothetical protein